MSRCKITVLKRMVHWDLVDEYMEPGAVTRPCPHFVEGQEFVVDDHPGSDFCNAAWNDIYKAYVALAQGGSFSPWMKEDGTVVVCCSDGVRPVFFKLERIEEGTPCQNSGSPY